MPFNMKKILIALLATIAFLPFSAIAAIATPWNATSTDIGGISPNLINGNNPFLKILSTGTSTFSSGVNITSGCFSIGNTCVGGVLSVFGRTGAVTAQAGDYTTAQVIESGNLYFTNARAITSLLTGFSNTTGIVTSSDSILTAIEKLSGNATSYLTNITGLVTQGTNVTITGAGTSGSPYVINATGGSGSSYPFPLAGNATSTLTQFNGGITAYATSTIGDGTQVGGLTTNGGATTTGNAYIAGSLAVGTTTYNNAFNVSGTGRNTLTYDAVNNRLGIGTTTPLETFDEYSNNTDNTLINTVKDDNVSGAWAQTVYRNSAFGPQYVANHAFGSQATPANLNAAGDDFLSISGRGWDGSTFAEGADVTLETSEPWDATNHGSQITFFTTQNGKVAGDVQRAEITNNGSLAVGTTSAMALLEVASSSASAANFFQFDITDTNAALNKKHWAFSSEGGNFYLGTTSDLYATSSPSALSILNTGNVGIGTSTPWADLSVGGANGVSNPGFAVASATDSSTQFIVAANGFTGIGTTSPSKLLSVNGTIYSASGGFQFPDGTVQTTAASGAGTVTSIIAGTGLSGGTITTSGTIAVNTSQNITTLSNLTVAGFVQTTSAGLLSSAALTSGQVTTALGFTPGQGTVTAIGVTTNQGVSGASSGGATPNLTISLGALTGVTSFNGLVVTANTGVITTGTWNGTTIAIARGGTNQTSFNTNSVPYFDGTSLNSSTNFLWQPTGDWFTLGTTTASRSLATLATSTAPQLLLTDGVSTPFTFRAVGNDFFMSTSSPTTFATSSISLLSIVPSPTDNATTTWSSMDFLIKQTSQVAFGIFDLFGTQVLNVNTASTTGSIFTVAATTSPSVFNPIKLFDVDQYGGITASSTGATPTVACTPSGGTLSAGSNDSAGTITAGTLSTACTVTFAHTKLSTPAVQATGSTVFAGVTAQSTTAFTVSMAATTGDTINYWVIQP